MRRGEGLGTSQDPTRAMFLWNVMTRASVAGSGIGLVSLLIM